MAAATALLVSSCTAESGNTDTGDVVGQGYASGDGSLQTWSVADRTDPVEISGTDFSGDPVDTIGDGDEIVVLNTWYAACPPCRAEVPALLEVATERASDGVRLVGINGTDDSGAALAFEREHGVTWPSIADTDGSAVAALQDVVPVQAVPTTVVLDRQGRVAARVLGQIEASTLDGLIDDVLAEPST
ncbi:thiol-disulfide isomerase/thioredoxin [Sanguibacter antarcticus]|uniref:Thiol-disulfide isomerase/thioredoxin n=1 Tax=Sanguibacter antarcticus TaxID=372484 RepID=A0A2A9E7E7_9MICO|nr:thiol-disulfide isomerase/thioredoxin [Sanguibacter antarcticus]